MVATTIPVTPTSASAALTDWVEAHKTFGPSRSHRSVGSWSWWGMALRITLLRCHLRMLVYGRPRPPTLASSSIKAALDGRQTSSESHRPHTRCTHILAVFAPTRSFSTTHPLHTLITSHHVRQGCHLHHRYLHRPCGRHSCPSGLRELQHWPYQLLSSVRSVSDGAVTTLLGLLGVVLQDVTASVGLNCSPISVIGVGGGAW